MRRQRMNSGRIASHRNYGKLMATHERDQKIRRVTRVVIYFLLIAFFIILFFMVSRWNNGQKQSQPEPGNTPVTYVAPQDYL
ncbi:MAG TPA: hypothetical protein VKZ75_01760 [Cyclobacteriaceae bacterium]|nr:hypothetical protein [Cyclobacteriaceae bacterium]